MRSALKRDLRDHVVVNDHEVNDDFMVSALLKIKSAKENLQEFKKHFK